MYVQYMIRTYIYFLFDHNNTHIFPLFIKISKFLKKYIYVKSVSMIARESILYLWRKKEHSLGMTQTCHICTQIVYLLLQKERKKKTLLR